MDGDYGPAVLSRDFEPMRSAVSNTTQMSSTSAVLQIYHICTSFAQKPIRSLVHSFTFSTRVLGLQVLNNRRILYF